MNAFVFNAHVARLLAKILVLLATIVPIAVSVGIARIVIRLILRLPTTLVLHVIIAIIAVTACAVPIAGLAMYKHIMFVAIVIIAVVAGMN
jgi:hypothetical protein